MTTQNLGQVRETLATIGWTLTHADPGGDIDVDQERVADDAFKAGRVLPTRIPSYSAQKSGTSTEMTFNSLDQLLAAINEWEAAQRPT